MVTDPTALLQGLLGTTGLGGLAIEREQMNNLAAPQSIALAQQAQGINNQLGQQQVADGAQAQAQAQAFQQDYAAYQANPTPEALGRLAMAHPEKAQQLQQAYALLKAPVRDSQIAAHLDIYNAAKNGRTDLLVKKITSLRDAEKARQIDTSDADDMLRQLVADPAGGTKNALSYSQLQLAAADPDFAKSLGIGPTQYEQFGSGGIFNKNTAEIVREPDAKSDKPEYQYDSANQRWLLKPGTGGGISAAPMAGGAGDAAYSRANIRGAESRGNDTATNSHGSAAGRYQFIGPTALRLMAQNPAAFPEAQGKGAADRLALARQPDVQERMMDIVEPQYRKALSAAGLPATGTNMYMAHFLGPDTATRFLKAAQADPNAPASAIIRTIAPRMADKIISGNGAIFAPGQTAAGVVGEIGRRYAGANGGGSGGDGFSRPAPSPSLPAPAGLPTVIDVPAATGNGAGALDSDTASVMADQYLAGDPSVMTGLGRGKQGAENIVALRKAIVTEAKSRGMSGAAIAAVMQDFKMHQKGLNAFAAGPEARSVRSNNVSIDHLDTLQNAAQALQNGSYPIFNKVAQGWARATGSAAPTNFEGVRSIVSAEVAKAITGGNTALADRQDLTNGIATSGSPQQLAGYIAEIKKLMAGQLSGLALQYKNATGRDDFANHLSPRTRHVLGFDVPGVAGQGGASVGSGAAPVRVSSVAQAMALPKGTVFVTPDGRTKVRP